VKLSELIDYVHAQRDGVVTTVGPDGGPQAAYLSLAATGRGELVFDAKADSRKVANLRRDPRVAVVAGGRDGTTLQGEGRAVFPEGEELARAEAAYLAAFPEFGPSLRRAGVVVILVRLNWARFGDYRAETPVITEVSLR
jgi:Pyridoxamine 5'-phosphate oxidase